LQSTFDCIVQQPDVAGVVTAARVDSDLERLHQLCDAVPPRRDPPYFLTGPPQRARSWQDRESRSAVRAEDKDDNSEVETV